MPQNIRINIIAEIIAGIWVIFHPDLLEDRILLSNKEGVLK